MKCRLCGAWYDAYSQGKPCAKCGGDPRGLRFSGLMLISKILLLTAMAMPFVIRFSGMYDIFGAAKELFPLIRRRPPVERAPGELDPSYLIFTSFSYIPAFAALASRRRSAFIPSSVAALIMVFPVIFAVGTDVYFPLFAAPAVLFSAAAAAAWLDKCRQLSSFKTKTKE